eukprot:gb/GECH01003592.1/.p1 GENE.gb/GECH01003592.1/~~gb/GECH01003592.1/.p1  ORF type:complete len:2175 (+),score=481.06 gb/GECH01003592.1/:1-6525(+)
MSKNLNHYLNEKNSNKDRKVNSLKLPSPIPKNQSSWKEDSSFNEEEISRLSASTSSKRITSTLRYRLNGKSEQTENENKFPKIHLSKDQQDIQDENGEIETQKKETTQLSEQDTVNQNLQQELDSVEKIQTKRHNGISLLQKKPKEIPHTILSDNQDIYTSIDSIKGEILKRVRKKGELPSIDNIFSTADDFRQQVILAGQPKNTFGFMSLYLKEFFEKLLVNLQNKRHLLLSRWFRFCNDSMKANECGSVLFDMLNQFSIDLENNWNRLERLKYLIEEQPQNKNNENQEDLILKESDFEILIRETLYDIQKKDTFRNFLLHFKWVTYLQRWAIISVYKKMEQEEMEQEEAPCPISSVQEVEDTLDELVTEFSLEDKKQLSDQEFFYAVNKKFTTIFSDTTKQMNFIDYSVYFEDIEKKTKMNMSNKAKRFLKEANWTNDSPVPQMPTELEQQASKLSSSTIDANLRAECNFISSDDLVYTTTRLKEYASSIVENMSSERLYKEELEDLFMKDKNSKEQLQKNKKTSLVNLVASIFLLRYLRIRKFRLNILSILNFYRSIERRLVLEQNQTKNHKKDDIVSQEISRQISFLNNTKNLTSFSSHDHQEYPEDLYDTFAFEDDTIIVRDAYTVPIIYDVAVDDINNLEDEILRYGTFIIKKQNSQKSVDRLQILEQIFEQESKFQNAKMKIIMELLEAYEHSVDEPDVFRNSEQLVNWINRRPLIDLEGSNVIASYKKENESLNQFYSLLSNITSYQLDVQHKINENILSKQSQNETIGTSNRPDSYISPNSLPTIKLVPKGKEISVFNIASSMAEIWNVFRTLQDSLSSICRAFNITQPLIILQIKLMIFEKASQLWKDKIYNDRIPTDEYYLDLPEQRRVLEESLLIKDPEYLISLINEANKENKLSKTGFKKKISGDFNIEKDPYAFTKQLYASTTEVLLIRKKLIESLSETDLLLSLYSFQARIMGREVLKPNLNSLPFEHAVMNSETEEHIEQGTGQPGHIPNSMNKMISNLAISEFESAMAYFNFQTSEGIKKLISLEGVKEFRIAFQMQLLQISMLSVAVQYNQIHIDDLYQHLFSYSGSDVFLTTTSSSERNHMTSNGSQIYTSPKNSEQFDFDSLPYKFLSVNATKIHERSHLLLEYNDRSASLLKSNAAELIFKSLRDLKFKLAEEFSIKLTQYFHSFALKTEIINTVERVKGLLLNTPKEDNPFIFGKPEDDIQKSTDELRPGTSSSSASCMVSEDGLVANVFYMPHYSQIIDMRFNDQQFIFKDINHTSSQINSKDINDSIPEEGSKKGRTMLKIANYMYLILAFMRSKCILDRSSTSKKKHGLDQLPHEVRKWKSEIESLSNPTDPSHLLNYLRMKTNMLYSKMLMVLQNLSIKFAEKEKMKQFSIVRHELDQLIKSGNLRLVDEDKCFDCDQYWPCAKILVQAEDNLPCTLRLLLQRPQSDLRLSITSFDGLESLLTRLSGPDRNYYYAEEMAVELEVEDILNSERIYSTSQSFYATEYQIEFLRTSFLWVVLKLMYFYILNQGTIESRTQSHKFVLFEKMFKKNIVSKAKQRFDSKFKESRFQIANIEIDRVSTNSPREMSQKKSRQLTKEILEEEIETYIMQRLTHRISELRFNMEKEFEDNKQLDLTSMSSRKEIKYKVFNQFREIIMKNSFKSARGIRPTIVLMREQINQGFNHLGKVLNDFRQQIYKEKEKKERETIKDIIGKIFDKEEKIRYLNLLDRREKEAIREAVEVQVLDSKRQAVCERQMFHRENNQLESLICDLEKEQKEKAKSEYKDIVNNIASELRTITGKFREYRSHLREELENNLDGLSGDAMEQIKSKGQSETTSDASAAERGEDSKTEQEQLREHNLQQQDMMMKIRTFTALKLAVKESKFKRQIEKSKQEKDTTAKEYWKNKEQIEQEEDRLRQKLFDTQNQLSTTEMEVEKLRSDLESQVKTKQSLVKWKVKNAQLIHQLSQKLKNYQKISQFDVDELLNQLKQKEEMVDELSAKHQELENELQSEEVKYERIVSTLRDKLQQENESKNLAFKELEKNRSTNQNMGLTLEHRSGRATAIGNEYSTWQRNHRRAQSAASIRPMQRQPHNTEQNEDQTVNPNQGDQLQQIEYEIEHLESFMREHDLTVPERGEIRVSKVDIDDVSDLSHLGYVPDRGSSSEGGT